MRNYLVFAVALVLGLLMCSVPCLSFAQEEELEYSWGTVRNVSSDKIVVVEYDYANDAELEVAYTVDSNVKLENADSLQDITVGDSVEVEYIIKDNEKIAKVIAVERPSFEELDMPEETLEEEDLLE